MTYTIHDGFILQTKRALNALKNILAIAEKQPNSSSLPTSRLYHDMKSLSFQVFAATLQTEWVLLRLRDEPIPEADTSNDVNYTYAEMYDCIDKVLGEIDAVDKDFIVANCEVVKPTPLGPAMMPLSGAAYADIMQANIFFHVTTAYGILRKEGIPLGKIDYIRPFIAL